MSHHHSYTTLSPNWPHHEIATALRNHTHTHTHIHIGLCSYTDSAGTIQERKSLSSIGLFCRIIGLFCSIIGLFCSIIGLFCCIIGLFCCITGLYSYTDSAGTNPREDCQAIHHICHIIMPYVTSSFIHG